MGPYLAQPNTKKHIESAQSQNKSIKYTLCEMQGWRRFMEDAVICNTDVGDGNSLFAVFDGHGGLEVSNYVKNIFVKVMKSSLKYQQKQYEAAFIDIFRKIDEMIGSEEGEEQLKKLSMGTRNSKDKSEARVKISQIAGTTANVLLITPKCFIVANCGDSRSVLCRKTKAVSMSFDHKPQNAAEFERIYNAGGQVINGRINGGLNLSRSLGDFAYKKNKVAFDMQMVTCLPDVRVFPRSENDTFILMGCDGIFENYALNDQPLITRISNELKTGNKPEKILSRLADSLLAKSTNQVSGCDNMTSILILFG